MKKSLSFTGKVIVLEKLKSKNLNLHLYIPSLVTYSGCFFGILSIYFSLTQKIENLKLATVLIILAGLMDKLDGYTARKLNAVSNFGRELDSLCDLVSFGIAPIILWWSMDSNIISGRAFLAAVVFIFSGIFRLARFNLTKEYENYIIGLPITIAGIILAFKHLFDMSMRYSSSYNISGENVVLVILLSILMVSDFKIKKFF